MTLVLELLPIYLFGNVHCFGMCGPLVAFLGKSPYRVWYLIGRIFSFSLVATLSSFLGIFITGFLEAFHLGFIFSLSIGLAMILALLFPRAWVPPSLGRILERASLLLLRGGAFPTFLFGVSTVFLPCGQSAIVFAAATLANSWIEGFLCGFCLAIFTTPALLFAMKGPDLFRRLGPMADRAVRFSGYGVGILACLRGFSSVGWISHASISLGKTALVFW